MGIIRPGSPMQHSQKSEILTGAAVILIVALLVGLSAAGSGRKSLPGYDVFAYFTRSDGLPDGAHVRMSGMDIGSVTNMELDDRFRSKVTLRITSKVQLPKDSSALIHTDGLLGGKYIEIQPGGDDAFIQPLGNIIHTQDSMIVEELLDKIVAMSKAKREQAKKDKQ